MAEVDREMNFADQSKKRKFEEAIGQDDEEHEPEIIDEDEEDEENEEEDEEPEIDDFEDIEVSEGELNDADDVDIDDFINEVNNAYGSRKKKSNGSRSTGPAQKKARTQGHDTLRFWDPNNYFKFNRKTEPLPHQKELVEWALPTIEQHGCVLIGDGMGLGKTLENLMLAEKIVKVREEKYADGQVYPVADQALIVCPKSVMDEWFDQLGQHYHAPQPNMRVFDRSMSVDDLAGTQLVLCTAQLLLRITGYTGQALPKDFMDKIKPSEFAKNFPNDQSPFIEGGKLEPEKAWRLAKLRDVSKLAPKAKKQRKIIMQNIRQFYFEKYEPVYAAFNKIKWAMVMLDEGDMIRNESGYNHVLTIMAARSRVRAFSSGTSFNNTIQELEQYLRYFRIVGHSPLIDEFLNQRFRKQRKFDLRGLWMNDKEFDEYKNSADRDRSLTLHKLILDYKGVDTTGLNKTQLKKLQDKQKKAQKAKEQGALTLPADLVLKVFAIRRTFDQVFPEKARSRHIHNIHIPMAPDQEKYYDKINGMDFGKDDLRVKEFRLRQAGTDPSTVYYSGELDQNGQKTKNEMYPPWNHLDSKGKIKPTNKLLMLLSKIRNMEKEFPGEKALVFLESVTLLRNILEPFFDENGYKGRYVSFCASGMTPTERTNAKNTLRNDKNCLFMFMIAKSAAGHNLACANHVFLLEHQYNPSVEEQAWARVDRLDQTKTIYIHRLISVFSDKSKGITADQKVVLRAASKRNEKLLFDNGKWQDKFQTPNFSAKQNTKGEFELTEEPDQPSSPDSSISSSSGLNQQEVDQIDELFDADVSLSDDEEENFDSEE